MKGAQIEILRQLTFLEGAEPEVVERLAAAAVERIYRPGDIILEEGATGGDMFLLVAGLVEVVKGQGTQQVLLAHREDGYLFGEMAFIEQRPRFATVRALEPTRVLQLPEETLRSLLTEYPLFFHRTLQMISARLRRSDLQRIADLQRSNEELARAYRELQEAQAALVEKERLERELELARDLQESILPREFPAMPAISCGARYRAARMVGGDFFDLISLDTARLGLVIADVSDKGMPAALFMALTRSLIRAEARRSASPREVLLNVHRLLLEMSSSNTFVTIFYGVLDLAQGLLTYARAGHNHPLRLRAGSSECQWLTGHGMMLGVVPDVVLEEIALPVFPGDLFVLYTDGVTDAKSHAGDFFGADALRRVVGDGRSLGAQALCDLIFAEVEQFGAGAEQYDDIALLVVRLDALA